LSDSKKTGGSRDISDLKARLGLKKGAAAPATGQTRANGASGGGVVAPPGMNLPAPPGVHPPQPVAPPPPDAASDPFGAMNHMAAVGTVQRAPEIVIVNDGKPVENVGSQSKGATIAKVAIPAVVGIALGIAVGKIGATNGAYNAGLSDVKTILGDKTTASTVANLKQQLSQLDTMLDEAKSRNSFKPDAALDKQLEQFTKALEMKTEVFKAKTNTLDPDTTAKLVQFYGGVAEVKSMIDLHLKSAKSDDQAFKKAKEKADAGTMKDADNSYLNGQFRYAMVMSAPTEGEQADFGAKLVELGPPFCGGKLATSGKCADGEAPSSFSYRVEPGATWTEGKLATSGSDSVPAKQIVMLLPGGVRDSLVKGAEGVASETYYQRRLRTIYDRIHGVGDRGNGLLNEGNKLETLLSTEAGKGKKFSFFM
jgi:hypothetical protein